MKSKTLILVLVFTGFSLITRSQPNSSSTGSDLLSIVKGEWVRMSPVGPISLKFNTDGTVEGDLGRDNSIDIVSSYTIENNTIRFLDKEGVSCPGTGIYEIHNSNSYLAFDLIEDNCGGRIKSTMGFWVRPDFEDRLKELTEKISASAKPEDYLDRARMYMAVGKSMEAKQDFDRYIKDGSADARVFVNRAGTRFPADLEGVVEDCNQAITLDPGSKNAYFLRGLALYQLGEKEKGCADFYQAIELGFEVLKKAEAARCSEIWKTYSTK